MTDNIVLLFSNIGQFRTLRLWEIKHIMDSESTDKSLKFYMISEIFM